MAKKSRSADIAEFKRACLARYRDKADEGRNIWCEEEGCGLWVADKPIPAHHLKAYAAGLGGRRKHDPGGLRFLCQPHHDDYEEHRLCECRFGTECSMKSCEEG